MNVYAVVLESASRDAKKKKKCFSRLPVRDSGDW